LWVMLMVILLMKQIYFENPPCRILRSEPGIWVSGTENGVLRRVSVPNLVIDNFVSPISKSRV